MNADLEYIRLRCVEFGECWLWDQSTTPSGYPRATLKGNKHTYAHIAAWNATHDRAIPKGLLVRRTCNERLCCNPAHLTLMTRSTQNRLAVERGAWQSQGRIAKITAAHRKRGKLTIELAREIRASAEPAAAWAERLNVDRSLIFRIRRNESWREGSANSSVFNLAQGA